MSESRAKKVQRNIFFSLGTFLLNFLVGYVSRIIFLKILDASYLGINGLFSNIIGILSLADLGIGTAMMYSLYAPIAKNDTAKINSLIAFFKKIYYAIAASVLCFGLILLPFLNHLVKLENSIVHLHLYYVLALLNTVISYLFVYRTTLIAADQKNYVISKYQMATKLVTFVFQTTILVVTKNYFLYLLVALIISFLGNLAQNTAAMRMYPYLKEKPLHLEENERTKIFGDVKSLFFYRLCGIIQTNTDNILISVMVGTIYVGYLSNYMMVITVFGALFGVVFQSIKASVGNMMASNESVSDKKFVFDVLEYLNFLLITFFSVGMAVLYQDFIEVSFGTEYKLPLITMFAIVANFYTSNIRQNIWTFRETTGIFHETKYITMVTAILNLIISIIAGKLWGLTGILWATVIARMLYAWWKEPIILYKKVFNTSSFSYIVVYFIRLCLVVILFIISSFVCSLVELNNHYLLFVLRSVLYSAISIVLCLAFTFWTKEFRWCSERFIHPLVNKIFKKSTKKYGLF